MTRRAAGVALVLAAGLAAACGLPVDKSPTALSRSGVPFGLLTPSTSTSTTGPAQVEVSVQIFLLAPNGHLAAVSRDVPFPAPLSTILGALVDGPTNTEAAAGLQNVIPPQTVVLGAAVTGQLATVNLGGTFGQLVGQSQIEAVAEIVFTATALPGVTQVTFQLNGEPIAVPAANGVQLASTNRSQYAPLAP
ncbi:MAG: GerMN domain-containing protein [Acidimicrobiales bacterium]